MSEITAQTIKEVVAARYNLKVHDIDSAARGQAVVSDIRHIAIYLSRQLTSLSSPQIGRAFGGRDHTTILHAIKKIEENIKVNGQLAEEVSLLQCLCEQAVQQKNYLGLEKRAEQLFQMSPRVQPIPEPPAKLKETPPKPKAKEVPIADLGWQLITAFDQLRSAQNDREALRDASRTFEQTYRRFKFGLRLHLQRAEAPDFTPAT